MKNLREGDVVRFIGDDMNNTVFRYEVRGVCGKVIFIKGLLNDGAQTPIEMRDVDDLITFGFTKE